MVSRPSSRPGAYVHRTYAFLVFKSLSTQKRKSTSIGMWIFWRRRRDLNPRYPFGVYTISNRARSASYATSPSGFCAGFHRQLVYNTSQTAFCQYDFSEKRINFAYSHFPYEWSRFLTLTGWGKTERRNHLSRLSTPLWPFLTRCITL